MSAIRLCFIVIIAFFAVSRGLSAKSVTGRLPQAPYSIQWQSDYLGGIPVWIARFSKTPELHKSAAYLFVQLEREYFADTSLKEVFATLAASQEKDRDVYVWVADDRDLLMRRITESTAFYRSTYTGKPRMSACLTPERTTNPYEVHYSRSDRGEYFTYTPYSPTRPGRKVVIKERTIPYTGNLETDLFLAIREYDVQTAKTLASKITRIEAATPKGDTPLMLAVLKREDEVVEILLERGASVRGRDKEGWTALMYAVSNKDVPTMQKLLARGAAVEATVISGKSVLSLACLGGHAETIKTLLDAGANINHRDREGKTPLLIAVEYGKSEAFAICLAAGADPLAQSRRGEAAFYLAAGEPDLLKLLKNRGIDIDARDRSGWTALMHAAEHYQAAKVRFLLENGADFTLTNKRGLTALRLAQASGHEEGVKILQEFGAVQ